MVGSKTDADLAIDFVKLDDLTDDERQVMTEAGRQGTVIVRDRHVEVADKDLLLPSQVAKEVDDQLPFEFTVFREHTEMWKRLGVRPAKGAPDPYATDAKYCVYSEAFRSYAYTRAWVKKILKEIGTAQKYREFFGRDPRMKDSTGWVPRQAGSAGTPLIADQQASDKAA
jgi:hypothetical protein